MRAPLLDRGAQGRPLPQEVLLTRELSQRGGTQANGQGLLGAGHRRARRPGLAPTVDLEQAFHSSQYGRPVACSS